jgi:hypothetical protein
MLKVFLSYHHNARKFAGRVKSCLTGLGMDVFLAHEDITPSAEWQKEILKKLRDCDVFIPLLTRSFRSSCWTDQETGIAFASNKFILPLKAKSDPHGFIGRFQALKVDQDIEGTCRKVAQVLISRPILGDRVRDGVIDAFLRSGSFEEAARYVAALMKLKPLSDLQLNRILEGAATNDQIYGGWVARDAVKKMVAEGGPGVRKRLLNKFLKQVQSRA